MKTQDAANPVIRINDAGGNDGGTIWEWIPTGGIDAIRSEARACGEYEPGDSIRVEFDDGAIEMVTV
jgi:hypothetical protein